MYFNYSCCTQSRGGLEVYFNISEHSALWNWNLDAYYWWCSNTNVVFEATVERLKLPTHYVIYPLFFLNSKSSCLIFWASVYFGNVFRPTSLFFYIFAKPKKFTNKRKICVKWVRNPFIWYKGPQKVFGGKTFNKLPVWWLNVWRKSFELNCGNAIGEKQIKWICIALAVRSQLKHAY